MLVCDNKYHIQHNPLDTRQQDPWHSLQGSGNPLEPKHLSEFDELDVTEWFHENVSRILIPGDVVYSDCLLLNLFMNPMVCAVYMLHGALVLRVFEYLDGQLVVHKQQRWMHCVIAKLFESY